ncbi:alanine:cation symporter family protein [Pseudohalioglobus sediminis]|uniref:Alanine:cation symporter family protein n=1 Tax=Pseudohalioglobus sediminis TaxID=2606449 RepID=A0A5B0WUF4_9GAMM|nr:alanine/glycine:cation symporter family protein [Pseudohalioglobus sediminis]KAA1189499.1 alanine:cation symporter family protein [Pseudohalioglobus sediminis]
MNKLKTRPAALLSVITLLLLCSNPVAAGLDQAVESFMAPITASLSAFVFYKLSLFGYQVPWIVLWLAVAASFFTLYLGFINIRGFALAFRLVRGDYHDVSAPGEISHFKAVATAVSGTVGVGNIGGVAVAIVIGGPGAAFWLIVAGFLSMSTKLVECTLGVKYRKHNPDGSVSGGPMYYLEHYLVKRGFPRLGKGLGKFYALALVIGCLGIGNMFQSNQAYVQFVTITGGEDSFFAERGWLFGLAIASLVGAVIIGGIRSIAAVAGKIVPLMAVLYACSALVIIAMSAQHIPAAINLIISSAFSVESATGGMVGAIIVGFQRALFSNEAGLGSAPIAHSAVQTDHPASEGFVSLLEPFIDTVVICTLSSLVIVVTAYPAGLMDQGLEGIALTSAAFEHHVSWAPYPLAIAALLFAFSTAIAWSYYGLKAWTYLFSEHPVSENLFKLMFCGFLALGCMIQLKAVLDFSDAMVFLISVPNILGLYFYAPEIKREINEFMARVKAGEIYNYRTEEGGDVPGTPD